MILAEPSADKPDPPTPVSPHKSMTAEEISQKLQQAEERRKVGLGLLFIFAGWDAKRE